ncbi:MAG TPA: hypothetical protein PK098_04090 [Phycisphaerales bacterium]|nr:hypothetical protein [Phycisphaerales bacterium]
MSAGIPENPGNSWTPGQAPELSPDDQRLLDALIDAGFEVSQLGELSAAEMQRVDRLMSVFSLMNDYPVDDADETLVNATLARIDRYEDALTDRMSFETAGTAARGISFRLPDFISVAAVMLIAAGVLWPMLHTMRQRSIAEACNSNLRLMGYAFGNYAADHNGTLPMALSSLGLGTRASWDTVSNVRVNLAPLLEGGYCTRGCLQCPGHETGRDKTYSYQWQKPGTRLTWGIGHITVIMTDRNPLIDAARAGIVLPPDTLSQDHGKRGQNALATDGSTYWLSQPVVGGYDNIWLPHGEKELRPGAQPRQPTDVFVAH